MDVAISRMIASDGGPKRGYFTPTNLRKHEAIQTTSTHFILGKHVTHARSTAALHPQPSEKTMRASSSALTLKSSILLGRDAH